MFRAPQLPRTLEAALRDVTAKKPNVRAEAARELVPHADAARERVVRALEAALRDEAAAVRSAAATALADIGGHEALPALLVAVEDDSPHVRQMAIAALGEIGDARATERLRRALADARPEIRFQAAMAFPRVCASRSDAIDALVVLTNDEDAFVCHIALRMAEELSEHAAEREGSAPARIDPRLLERSRALLAHASPMVKVVSAVLLARAGERDGCDVLAAVALGELVSDDKEDEAAAIELCGELGLEKTRAALERRAFGGLLRRDPLAWHARVALARMGHERASREILGELGARDRDRRTMAVAAAGRARLRAAHDLIAAMRDDEARADPGAVDEALALLAGAGGAPAPAARGGA